MLGRLHRRDVGLLGARRGDEVGHLGHGVDVGHRHVAVAVSVRMARVVDALEGAAVGDDARDLHAARRRGRVGHGRVERVAEGALCAGLGEDDDLAPVRLAVGALGRLRVGEVLGRDVHAQALGREAGAGDVDGVEEAHYWTPIAERRIDRRVLMTAESASYCRPFLACAAASTSMSTELPSWRTADEASTPTAGLTRETPSLPWPQAACRADWKSTSCRR